MKIMIILTNLIGGGAERVAAVLAGGFAEKGHEVIFASDKERKDEPFIYQIDNRVRMVKCFEDSSFYVSVRKHPFFRRFIPLLHNRVRPYLNIRKTILAEKPDIVLSFMLSTYLKTFIASAGTNSIIIASEHDSFERPRCAPMKRKDYIFKFWITKLFNATTVLTEADKRAIGNRLQNIYVIPNPLAFHPIGKHNLSDRRQKQIVAAGRIDAWHCKGFDILIRAWGKIAEKCKGWTLNIAGEGNEYSLNCLKKIAEDCHVEDKIIFSGYHKNLDLLFRQSEIFVLSSRYEGFGMVLIEAMSQGCACIACDYKGRQREIIRNETEGLCIEPEDVEQLAGAISRMITDEVYRNSVRINGISRSKEHDVSAIADRWLDMFEEIQQRKNTKRNSL